MTSLPVRMRTAISSSATYVAITLVGIGLPQAVFGQGHNQATPSPNSGPANMRNFGAGPPGGPRPQVPAIPGAKGAAVMPENNPTKLPDNFSPPPVKDEVMSIDLPLAKADEIEKLKKDLGKYQTVLRTAKSSDADKALIKNGLRYRLALMCQKEKRSELSTLHEALLRDLNSAAQAPENAAPANVRAFRQMVMQELVSQVTPLLTTQNFHVRLHMAMLLGELNITEENTKLALKQEAYAPAADTLIQVIGTADQPEGVKIVAVNGLVRILKQGKVNITSRTKIAQTLVAELANKKIHPWYQMRLSGSLAAVEIDLVQGNPIIVNELKAVMTDGDREWSVRAEAAKSLGRVPLPAAANPQGVVKAIAEFTLKLAKAAQQAPPQKGDETKWKAEFFKVYLAFQQLDATDVNADKTTKAGLLNNPAAAAKPAYDLIIPLVVAVLHGQRLTVQQIQSLEGWVNPNKNAPVEARGSDAQAPRTTVSGGPNKS